MRSALIALVSFLGLPVLNACAPAGSPMPDSYVVEIWTDSNPENRMESHAILLASGAMKPHAQYEGLHVLEAPVKAALPSGLSVEVTCERVATGFFHCGTSHAGKLVATGKYSGPFTVRVFPDGQQSYVLDVKASEHPAGGT